MARKRGLTTAAVVQAAASIADAEGLAAVTLASVAQRLGIRSPSLYAHVEGLTGLRRRLALEAAAVLFQAMQEAGAKRSGADALRAMAVAYRRFAWQRPGLYQAVQRAVRPGEDDELYTALAAAVRPVFRALAELNVAPAERVHLARAFRAALHGFVALEQSGGFGLPESVEESFARMVELLVAAAETAAVAGRGPAPQRPAGRPPAREP